MKESGLYIHVPYCRKKCLYCDFYSGGATVAEWHRFVDAVLVELTQRKIELPSLPTTIYIGGGTPSLLPADELLRLVDGVKEILGMDSSWREFTVEVNPDDVTDELCLAWVAAGVTRVSMGVQSFNDEELRKIGRRHDSRKGVEAYQILRRYFNNISIDVMFGLPGQTLSSWEDSVRTVVALYPEHISAYTLMFEEGTAMTLLRDLGKLEFPTDEECEEMWSLLTDILENCGYHQYEISNYSRGGYESIHNRRYWRGNPYLGLGPSAHSYDGYRIRRGNPGDLKGYLKHFGTKAIIENETNQDEKRPILAETPFYKEERLTDEELHEEYIMLRMRMMEGIELSGYGVIFGKERLSKLKEISSQLIKSGLLEGDDGVIHLSKQGVMIADEVVLKLLM